MGQITEFYKEFELLLITFLILLIAIIAMAAIVNETKTEVFSRSVKNCFLILLQSAHAVILVENLPNILTNFL